MHIVVTLAIVINIIAIILLLIGLLCNFKNPKSKAIFGYFVVGSMLMYILSLGIIAIYELFAEHKLYALILFLCVILPFIIGKLVNYNSLKKYTIIQIFCCFVSLIILLILL